MLTNRIKKPAVKKNVTKKPIKGSFKAIEVIAGLFNDDPLDLKEIRKKSWR
jgi:hypothetical protein